MASMVNCRRFGEFGIQIAPFPGIPSLVSSAISTQEVAA
jgi:hypothetical protein